MTTDRELLTALRGRLPNTRRMCDFYRKLDNLIPDWASVVNAAQFHSWMIRVDSESGACMFDRLKLLWQHPLYSAEDFAILLRLFARSEKRRQTKKEVSSLYRPHFKGWARCSAASTRCSDCSVEGETGPYTEFGRARPTRFMLLRH